MDAAEVLRDLRDHVDHLLLVGDVADIAARLAAGRPACRYCLVQPLLAKVHQGQAGATAGEILRHCPTQALATAGDDDHAVVQLHSLLLECACCQEHKHATTADHNE